MRLLLTAAAAIVAAAPVLAEPRVVGFTDLPDPAAASFEDPFAAMGLEALEDLRTVVRVQSRLESETFDVPTRDRLSALVTEARQSLTAGGHDVEALLAVRWEVAVNRKRARLATNPALDGTQITMDGFLIPAEPDPDGASVAYLVAEVGLCSHKPVPPPNELVRVRYEGQFPSRNLYVPVSVTGVLMADPQEQSVIVLDGDVDMVSMWRLSADQVTLTGPDTATAGNINARPEFDPFVTKQGSD